MENVKKMNGIPMVPYVQILFFASECFNGLLQTTQLFLSLGKLLKLIS